jgi:hypothetical protein
MFPGLHCLQHSRNKTSQLKKESAVKYSWLVSKTFHFPNDYAPTYFRQMYHWETFRTVREFIQNKTLVAKLFPINVISENDQPLHTFLTRQQVGVVSTIVLVDIVNLGEVTVHQTSLHGWQHFFLQDVLISNKKPDGIRDQISRGRLFTIKHVIDVLESVRDCAAEILERTMLERCSMDLFAGMRESFSTDNHEPMHFEMRYEVNKAIWAI